MPGFRARPGSPRGPPAWLCCPAGPAGRDCGDPALHSWGAGRLGNAAGVGGGGGSGDPGRRPCPLACGLRAPAATGSAPRLGTGRARPRREEAGRRGNNVVGCFADCQPRSRILLSTPLGLTATGPARRRKSPLIWSWKERGKVILRCLRRWVIGPQLWARTRLQCRLPPVGGGAGQRLAEAPKVVNKLRRFRYLRFGVFFCVRWLGREGEGVTRGGAGRGSGWGWGGGARKEEDKAFLMRQPNLQNQKIGFSGGCDFAVSISCDPFARAQADAGVGFGVIPAAGCKFLDESRYGARGSSVPAWGLPLFPPPPSTPRTPHPFLLPPMASNSGVPASWGESPAFFRLGGSAAAEPKHQPRAGWRPLALPADPHSPSARQKLPSPFSPRQTWDSNRDPSHFKAEA